MSLWIAETVLTTSEHTIIPKPISITDKAMDAPMLWRRMLTCFLRVLLHFLKIDKLAYPKSHKDDQ